jgi:hypothetical protein
MVPEREWCSCGGWPTARNNRWIYLARVTSEQCTIEYIAKRFGGGDYRAKILGAWDPERRYEQDLERVSFAIDMFYPITAETRAQIANSA